MMRKPTLSKRIEMFFEDIFWITYILFMILALVAAFGIFASGLWTTFVA